MKVLLRVGFKSVYWTKRPLGILKNMGDTHFFNCPLTLWVQASKIQSTTVSHRVKVTSERFHWVCRVTEVVHQSKPSTYWWGRWPLGTLFTSRPSVGNLTLLNYIEPMHFNIILIQRNNVIPANWNSPAGWIWAYLTACWYYVLFVNVHWDTSCSHFTVVNKSILFFQ